MDDSQSTPSQETSESSAQSISDLPEIISDRYDVLKVIGSGGAGVVYKARDKSLNKLVAIKRLHNSANKAQSIRFHREAKLLAALNHPNVMTAIDFGLTGKNEPYLVLDYVNGKTLSRWLKENGPMPVPLALAIFTEIACGLAHAHSKKIVHRDIKPSNVMLIDQGENQPLTARIVDFGLARETEANQNFTAKGVGIGTPKYMSPEQIHGAEIDERSDIYSLGCLMYEVLTGTPPFRGETALETMNMHLSSEPDPVAVRALKTGGQPEISSNFQLLIEKCLKKNPAERFQNCDELIAALEEESDLSASDQQDAVAVLPSANQGSRFKLAAATIVVILLVVLSDVLIFDQQPENSKEKSAPVPKVFEEIPMGSYDEMPGAKRPKHDYQSGATGAGDNDLAKYLEKTKSVSWLNLSESNVTVEGLRLLREHPELEALNVQFHDGEANRILDEICTHKSLTSISLRADHSYLALGSVKGLIGLTKLHTIVLIGCALTVDNLEDISRIPNLRHLGLLKCKGIDTSIALSKLSGCSKLERLSLDETDETDESIKVIYNWKLSQLSLISTKHLTDEAIIGLSKMPLLTNLYIEEPSRSYTVAVTKLKRARAELGLPQMKISVEEPFD